MTSIGPTAFKLAEQTQTYLKERIAKDSMLKEILTYLDQNQSLDSSYAPIPGADSLKQLNRIKRQFLVTQVLDHFKLTQNSDHTQPPESLTEYTEEARGLIQNTLSYRETPKSDSVQDACESILAIILKAHKAIDTELLRQNLIRVLDSSH